MKRRPYFLVAVGLLAPAGCHQKLPPPIPPLLSEVKAHESAGLQLAHSPTELESAILVAVRGTRFESTWQVNRPTRAGWLTIFMVGPGGFGVRDNCAYLGFDDTIVCDATYVESFLEGNNVPALRRAKDPSASTATAIRRLVRQEQQAFVTWIIAHELGHLLDGKAAHFARPPTEETPDSELQRTRELRADHFAAEQVLADDELSIHTESMLTDLISSEVYAQIGETGTACVGICFDYSNRKLMNYMERGSHPEFVIRAVRMLRFLCESREDLGLCGDVASFERNLHKVN